LPCWRFVAALAVVTIVLVLPFQEYGRAIVSPHPMLREESLAAVSATGFVGVIPTTNAPPRNVRAAADWYLARASSGDPAAQYEIAVRYAEGRGVAKDYTRAAAWFREAAINGVAAAQYDLGILYDKGLGLARDPIEAVIWYKAPPIRTSRSLKPNLAWFISRAGLYREIRKRPSAGYGARPSKAFPTPRRRLPVFMNKGMASRARIKAPMQPRRQRRAS